MTRLRPFYGQHREDSALPVVPASVAFQTMNISGNLFDALSCLIGHGHPGGDTGSAVTLSSSLDMGDVRPRRLTYRPREQ